MAQGRAAAPISGPDPTGLLVHLVLWPTLLLGHLVAITLYPVGLVAVALGLLAPLYGLFELGMVVGTGAFRDLSLADLASYGGEGPLFGYLLAVPVVGPAWRFVLEENVLVASALFGVAAGIWIAAGVFLLFAVQVRIVDPLKAYLARRRPSPAQAA